MPLNRICRIALGLVVVPASLCQASAAPMQVLAAQYRADTLFPEFQAFWKKDSAAPSDDAKAEVPPGGGSIHIHLRNPDLQAADITDVRLENISLTQAVAESAQRKFKKHLYASSIHFSKLAPAATQRLIALGEPVWWRADPKRLEPGGNSEIVIRLRKSPPEAKLSCQLELGDGRVQEIAVATASVGERCADICFSPSLDTAWLYFTGRENGRAPARILLDGQDVTANCTIRADPRLKLVPLVCRPPKAFAPASLHCFQALYEGGSTAIATIRAFPSRFVYGTWGARPGKETDVELGKGFLQELAAHNINLQMPGVGSPAVSAFYKSAEGRAMLQALGVSRVVDSVGKGGAEQPYAYYLADEPDAADSRVQGLPRGRQIGCLAQGLVGWGEELRRQDPLTPHMLNLDFTFPPFNWYIYGQLPDIFAADPYYQPRLRQALAHSPERAHILGKATLVFAESVICKSACEPRPLHIILYANRYEKGQDRFRGPTPPEKRIEAFYALAAGAKGLSYWWYSPGKPAVGLGAAEPEARALWQEVGLMGAEFRTAGPLLARSSPLPLPVSAPPKLWVKSLAAGLDSLLLTVVNNDYTNDSRGTQLNPVSNAVLQLAPPAWMQTKDIFEISPLGTKEVSWHTNGPHLTLELGPVNVSRLLVLASDPALRQTLQREYDALYAANVKKLLKPQL